jgi:hypothetical protein
VEDFKDVYPEFCGRLGITADHALLEALATDINTRSHGRLLHLYDELCLKLGLYPVKAIRTLLSRGERTEAKPERLTWPALEDLDTGLARSIAAKAREYGYSAP